MNLTRNLYLLFLCGMCTPAVHAAGNMTTDAAVQQTVNQDVDEMKLKELQDFRKKYKLADPKASESELKATQMAVKIYADGGEDADASAHGGLCRDRSRLVGRESDQPAFEGRGQDRKGAVLRGDEVRKVG